MCGYFMGKECIVCGREIRGLGRLYCWEHRNARGKFVEEGGGFRYGFQKEMGIIKPRGRYIPYSQMKREPKHHDVQRVEKPTSNWETIVVGIVVSIAGILYLGKNGMFDAQEVLLGIGAGIVLFFILFFIGRYYFRKWVKKK